MRRRMRWMGSLLLAAFLAVLPAKQSLAADYTYTVTVYAGARGSFETVNISSTEGVSLSGGGPYVKIENIKKGIDITLNNISSCITLNESDNGKYYVKGLRKAGQSTETEDKEIITQVDKDQDYVVAYGISSNKVAYTVEYRLYESNETLLASRTGYADAGDSIVVGYASIPGYTPYALNLTKKLSSNPSENVFTFYYYPTGTITVTDEVIETVYNLIPGETTVVANPGTTAAAAAQAGGGGGGGGVAVPDQETPLANVDIDGDGQADAADLVEIEEEETPLNVEELEEESSESGALRNLLPIYVSIAVLALAGFLGGFLFLKKAKKKEEIKEEDQV